MSAGWALAVFLTTAIVQAGQIDFDLLNNTRFEFGKLWIAKHGTRVWNLVGQEIPVGGQKHVSLRNDIDWRLWDLKIEYRAPQRRFELFTDQGFELPKIKRIVITVVSGEKWDAHYE